MEANMQNELTHATPLLDDGGNLVQIGWSRQPIWIPNLEKTAVYPRIYRFLQFIRMKRWNYFAVFSPSRFFSATLADLGYAGNIFVYTLDFENGQLHEEGLVTPLSKGLTLAEGTSGTSSYEGKEIRLHFQSSNQAHQIQVDWPSFHDGKGIYADLQLSIPPEHQSMNITIPIPGKRYYYNHKVNCLPATGFLRYGNHSQELHANSSLGQLDWGRGVWQYSSFWNWASASGFLPDGRTIGLNLGCGFGDTSAATENAIILQGRVHKLDQVTFEYNPENYMETWKFRDNHKRLVLDFHPFKDRLATTHLGIIDSVVHQMFGHYQGYVTSDEGEVISIHGLTGFAEEHQARW
jgi:hypothetical protein